MKAIVKNIKANTCVNDSIFHFCFVEDMRQYINEVIEVSYYSDNWFEMESTPTNIGGWFFHKDWLEFPQ